MNRDDSFDVFVSHSAKDRLIADALVERLGSEGIRYWIAPESIPAGMAYSEAIATDIPRCRVVLVLLSDKSNHSHQVERELLCALEEGKPILPVRIEQVEPSTQLRYALTGAQRLDAFPAFRQHLDDIAGSLHPDRAKPDVTPAPSPSPPGGDTAPGRINPPLSSAKPAKIFQNPRHSGKPSTSLRAVVRFSERNECPENRRDHKCAKRAGGRNAAAGPEG